MKYARWVERFLRSPAAFYRLRENTTISTKPNAAAPASTDQISAGLSVGAGTGVAVGVAGASVCVAVSVGGSGVMEGVIVGGPGVAVGGAGGVTCSSSF